jgi:hypothetical protein
MRKWVSFAAILAAFAAADSGLADTPPAVYSDFAEDGVLSCGHSRSTLKGVLNDASLHQYGDPLTFIGLKLAVRKQLAGGCRRSDRSGALGSGGRSPAAFAPQTDDTTKSSGAKTKKPPRKKERSLSESKGLSAAGATTGVQQDGWMILVGVALLLLTLGSGGWAARRAFTDQR